MPRRCTQIGRSAIRRQYLTFNEDACRIRRGDGAQNFAILRRIALNLIKQDKSGKSSVRTRRLKAGWSIDYLQKLLGLHPR